MDRQPIRLAFDIGGTFTDIVLDTGGAFYSVKVLTTPAAPEKAALEGIADVLTRAGVMSAEIDLVIHGTTLATNAIIERKGARTALLTTQGFRDSLEMAYESRFEQYDVFIERVAPLVERRLRYTVAERMSAKGEVILPLDEEAVAEFAEQMRQDKIQSLAIGFLHSYANPSHEKRAAAIIADVLPGLPVTLSSEVCPEIREYERLSTAVANAYVQPLMSSYLTRLQSALVERGATCPMFLMTSAGGLTDLEVATRFPIRLIESGPAGGAILATHLSAAMETPDVLSFDMGGTTAKICLIDGGKAQGARLFEIDRRYRFVKGSGLPVRIPVIEMVEIGAGGGSIAAVDASRRITIGPRSAGADPGPACYRRGGTEPTVTDANVALGKIAPEGFAGGRFLLDKAAASSALARSVGEPLDLAVSTAAYGVVEIVEENMANAARVHAAERGSDLQGRVMIAFGGAAPLHAARVAEKLGIGDIVIPAYAGVGSAIGFLRAPVSIERARSLYMRLSAFDAGKLHALVSGLVEEATLEGRRAAPAVELVVSISADMRYVGQGHEVVIPITDAMLRKISATDLARAFETHYRSLYGRVIPHLDIEILTWTICVSTALAKPSRQLTPPDRRVPVAESTRQVYDPQVEAFVSLPVFARDGLLPGDVIEGPAIVVEDQTTTIVTASFDLRVDTASNLRLKRKKVIAR